jgi:hypothetical protein
MMFPCCDKSISQRALRLNRGHGVFSVFSVPAPCSLWYFCFEIIGIMKSNGKHASEFKIPGNGRQYREQRNLFGLDFQRSIIRIAFLVEVNKIRIGAAVKIVNAEDP